MEGLAKSTKLRIEYIKINKQDIPDIKNNKVMETVQCCLGNTTLK